MTYKEVLKVAQQKCLQKDISEQVALMLLLELSNKEAHNLYMDYEAEMDEMLYNTYQIALQRILNQEPLQHVLGFEYFYGYKFKVNKDVLIPRPETQELVANVLERYDHFFNGEDVEVIDVGCGSGAIAISLQLEEPHFHVCASDISEKALNVAKENAYNLQADVKFYQGDMLLPFMQMHHKVDILVSNPPYIPAQEKMEESVVEYEPHVALFGGDDGLYFYQKIFENVHTIMKAKSMLAFEIGWDQKETLNKLARDYFPNAKIEVLQDIFQKDRMLFIYNEEI